MILGFIGTIKYLDEKKILNNIKNYYGTSAGSILCSMLAIGYTVNEIYDFVMNFDLKKILDNVDITNIFENYGILSGRNMEIISKYIIAFKKNENYSFKQLYDDHKITLNIYAVCITDKNLYTFNNINTPNIPIWKAIVASSRIPYLYIPYTIDNKQYIDGAVMDPYPINNVPLNELDYTIGIYSDISIDTDLIKYINIPNICYYLQILNMCLNINYNLYSKFHPITIYIKNSSTSNINFYLTFEQKKEIFKVGYDSTVKQYPTLKFNNIKIKRSKSF